MRELPDAGLELRLRRALTAHLGTLPLDLTPERLERKREIRELARRRRRRLVWLGLAAALVLPAGWLAAGAPVPRPSDLSLVVPTPVIPSRVPIPAAVGVDRLAYSVDGDVYLADPDGRNPVLIADGTQNADFWAVAWSPDGRHLSYSGDHDIHVVDTTGKAVFTTPSCCSAWSPDGSLIATLVVDRTLSSHPDAGPGQVEVNFLGRDGVRRSGRSWRASANFLGSGAHILWSPDGRWITITGVTFSDGADVGPGWRIPVDGLTSEPLAIVPVERSDSYASPDGTLLVGTLDGQLVIAAADGSGAKPLVPAGSLPASLVWFSALWSPDGTQIAASAGSEDGNTLYVIDVATGNLTLLVDGPGEGFGPIDPVSWDGQRDRILFRSGDELSAIDADGSDTRLVARGAYYGDFQPVPVGSQ